MIDLFEANINMLKHNIRERPVELYPKERIVQKEKIVLG